MKKFFAFSKNTKRAKKDGRDIATLLEHVDAQIGRAVTRLADR